MILYTDTSALVKRFIKEKGSDEINQLLATADIVGSSLLTQVEMVAAIGKASRMNWLDTNSADIAVQNFLSDWQFFTRLFITPPLIERSSRLAWELGLRGYDATHLATALLWKETLENEVVMVTYDKELWTAAIKTGLQIWPDDLISQF
jgi:predicted nucleic acid-binding protein